MGSETPNSEFFIVKAMTRTEYLEKEKTKKHKINRHQPSLGELLARGAREK